jgi:hypothetical protein
VIDPRRAAARTTVDGQVVAVRVVAPRAAAVHLGVGPAARARAGLSDRPPADSRVARGGRALVLPATRMAPIAPRRSPIGPIGRRARASAAGPDPLVGIAAAMRLDPPAASLGLAVGPGRAVGRGQTMGRDPAPASRASLVHPRRRSTGPDSMIGQRGFRRTVRARRRRGRASRRIAARSRMASGRDRQALAARATSGPGSSRHGRHRCRSSAPRRHRSSSRARS